MTTPLRTHALAGALMLTLVGCHSSSQPEVAEPSPADPPAATAPASPSPVSQLDVPADVGPSRAYLHAQNVPSSGLALEGYCPVAYFAVNEPVRGKREFRSDHGGVTYLFVSADAKAAFDAEPKKFVPAYGGWCAFGMSVGDKFPVDPRSFKIVDGRLLLFLDNEAVDARELWEQGEQAELLRKAAATWAKVQG